MKPDLEGRGGHREGRKCDIEPIGGVSSNVDNEPFGVLFCICRNCSYRFLLRSCSRVTNAESLRKGIKNDIIVEMTRFAIESRLPNSSSSLASDFALERAFQNSKDDDPSQWRFDVLQWWEVQRRELKLLRKPKRSAEHSSLSSQDCRLQLLLHE